jgi:hypothetical protein
MKSNKTAGKNKDPKRAAKKELQQNLSDKFFEAVKSLGHDAEKIGEDLMLVSKFVAKKLSKKISGGKKEALKKVAEVLPEKPSAAKREPEVKKIAVKGVKKAQKVVQKASARVKPVAHSVKVAAIASEDKLKQAIAVPAAASDVKVAKAEKPGGMKDSVAKRSKKKVKPADQQ